MVGELLGRQGAQGGEVGFVGVVKKAAVQFGFYVVTGGKLAGFAEDFLYFLANFRRRLQGGEVGGAGVGVDSQAGSVFIAQDVARGEDGAFVGVDKFERHGQRALCEQGFFGGVEAFAQGVGIQV